MHPGIILNRIFHRAARRNKGRIYSGNLTQAKKDKTYLK